ncbi:PilZ domain-containing protein [Sphingomonas donggukensis]|uniref:PilZ domain-containing protein n=1 Tax=Sphingomonas donggukensis TaxID=2949093 RepID=A0ABY4TRP7_9SPHN|nr:PilZ domain-containing protein [Sphingomonas donggukensis]URW74917.1 PilZ domain-containing protein [Sphingomonas donggukensis]
MPRRDAFDTADAGREKSLSLAPYGRGMSAPATLDREARVSVMLSAEVERFGVSSVSMHRVRNLSRHGACIDQAGRFVRGQTIVVTVGTVAALGASVVWVSGEQAGLRFAQPIDVDAARAKAAIPPPPAANLRMPI